MRESDRRGIRWLLLTATILAVAVATGPGIATAGGAVAVRDGAVEESNTEESAGAVRVEAWRLLGPVADPLPAFHDAQARGFDTGDRLDEVRVPRPDWIPADGEEVSWFGSGNLTWQTREADVEGRIVLTTEPPAEPTAAWLATGVHAPRFRTVNLTVESAAARRVWLDGEKVMGSAAGGTGEAEVDLIPGDHLLFVEVVKHGDDEDGGQDAGSGDDELGEGDEPWTLALSMAPADGASHETATADGSDDDSVRDDKAVAGTAAAPRFAFHLSERRNLDILDVLDPPHVTSVALSPDGALVAASMSRILPGTDREETWIEVRSTDDGSLVRTWRGGVEMREVEWAPAGHRVSYLAAGEAEGTSTLWLADLESHETEPLLEEVKRFSDYVWSPTGETIAYSTTVEEEDEETGIQRVRSIRDRWSYFRTKTHLHLLSVGDGTRRRLTAGPVDTTSPAFSRDGRRLMFARSLEDVDERPYTRTQLWEIDLESLAARLLVEDPWINGAIYAGAGGRLLVLGGPSAFGEVGVAVPEGTIPNDYDGQLYLFDPATEEVRALTRDFDPAVVDAHWSRADGQVYLLALEQDEVRPFRLDPESQETTGLETGFDVFGDLAVAADAAMLAGTGSSPWEFQALVAVDPVAGEHRVLDRPAADRFARVRKGVVEPFDFQTADGTTIDGRVYLPPDFDRERRYPAIVYYYGGTNPVTREFGGRYPKEYWASMGYVVYVPQPSGATGFGQEFSARHVNDWGQTTSEEIVQGTREFLRAHPFVDPERVGSIGASYGGFMTMLLTTKTDVYSAAVAHAGISSIASYWGEGYWGYAYSAVATAGSFPWNRPDLYVEQSPLFRADRAQVPILLTHGTVDTNVPPGESEQFFVALRLLGKEVEYLRVAGQNHWVLDHAKRIRWSRSIVAWFDRWLKDEPAWWNDLYPGGE